MLATYSITDERRQIVGQAGPYYLTGQQLLVKKGSDIKGVADIKGKEVCSVTGSTSLDNVEQKGAKPRGFDTYSECRDQVLDGTVGRDDHRRLDPARVRRPEPRRARGRRRAVLRGALRRRLQQGQPEMCQWINETLQKSFDDGNWQKAFDSTLGKSGADAPSRRSWTPCTA